MSPPGVPTTRTTRILGFRVSGVPYRSLSMPSNTLLFGLLIILAVEVWSLEAYGSVFGHLPPGF